MVNHPNRRRRAIYATRDFNSNGCGTINRNAVINKFATTDAAREYLLAGYDPTEWDTIDAVIAPCTDYGDAWIKSISRPTIGCHWIAPFSYNQLRIERPGQHPGGKFYWITPVVDVLVLGEIQEIGGAAFAAVTPILEV